jgi:chitin synthase
LHSLRPYGIGIVFPFYSNPSRPLDTTAAPVEICHSSPGSINRLQYQGDIIFEWSDITTDHVVINGKFVDILPYLDNPGPFGNEMLEIIVENRGKDVTRALYSKGLTRQGECLSDLAAVGFVSISSIGCVVSDTILWISLILIVGVVLLRFFIALFFAYFLGNKLGASVEDLKQQLGLSSPTVASESGKISPSMSHLI